MAGLIAWKSNRSAPIPLKVFYSIGGIFISTILTHERFRNVLIEKISKNIPDNIKENNELIDENIGKFGANYWNKIEDLVNQVKNKVKNKQTE